ncbi:PQQ-binding-like beta-propeller repeat protein [candidate division WOR-3 bacterium]|nr:PQQ-binding-like beta-propeller repeat protein [candidate division WOR-3 bacterium]
MVFILFLISYSLVNIPSSVDENTYAVSFHYSKDGENWDVIGRRTYPLPHGSFSDSLLWLYRPERFTGKIKVVYHSIDGERTEDGSYSLCEINEIPDIEYRKLVKNTDEYAWRMGCYNENATCYYPHDIYPPLEYQWIYPSDYPIHHLDIQNMIITCANDMVYVGGMGCIIGSVVALDIETGEEVWRRSLTSNVWTTAVGPGDTLLFVGTSIGGMPDDTTLFCLDARTGKKIWGVSISTVLFNPILVVDSLIFVISNEHLLNKITINGNWLWQRGLDDDMGKGPTYGNGRIYVGGCAVPGYIYCYDAHTGDSLWAWGGLLITTASSPLYHRDTLFVTSSYGVYALNASSGNEIWARELQGVGWTLSTKDSLIYSNSGYWVVQNDTAAMNIYCLKRSDGEVLWTDTIVSEFGRPGATALIPVTSSNLIYMGGGYVGAIDALTGEIVYLSDSTHSSSFNAQGLPVLYKTWLVGGVRSHIYAYKGRETGGVEIYEDTPMLTVFPTIVHNKIEINTDVSDYIKIYDIAGKFLFSISICPVKKTYNLPSLPEGIYFLKSERYKVSVKIIKLR